jgi:hypothetical protein
MSDATEAYDAVEDAQGAALAHSLDAQRLRVGLAERVRECAELRTSLECITLERDRLKRALSETEQAGEEIRRKNGALLEELGHHREFAEAMFQQAYQIREQWVGRFGLNKAPGCSQDATSSPAHPPAGPIAPGPAQAVKEPTQTDLSGVDGAGVAWSIFSQKVSCAEDKEILAMPPAGPPRCARCGAQEGALRNGRVVHLEPGASVCTVCHYLPPGCW